MRACNRPRYRGIPNSSRTLRSLASLYRYLYSKAWCNFTLWKRIRGICRTLKRYHCSLNSLFWVGQDLPYVTHNPSPTSVKRYAACWSLIKNRRRYVLHCDTVSILWLVSVTVVIGPRLGLSVWITATFFKTDMFSASLVCTFIMSGPNYVVRAVYFARQRHTRCMRQNLRTDPLWDNCMQPFVMWLHIVFLAIVLHWLGQKWWISSPD